MNWDYVRGKKKQKENKNKKTKINKKKIKFFLYSLRRREYRS
jgi:hypothetical protein